VVELSPWPSARLPSRIAEAGGEQAVPRSGIEQRTELRVQARGHLLCLRACAFQGLGCGFCLWSVFVLEAPFDLAGLVRPGLHGKVERLCGVIGCGLYRPALRHLELPLRALGRRKLLHLEGLHRGDGLVFALNGGSRDAGILQGLHDGV